MYKVTFCVAIVTAACDYNSNHYGSLQTVHYHLNMWRERETEIIQS